MPASFDRLRRLRDEVADLRSHQRLRGLKIGSGEYVRGAIGAADVESLDAVRTDLAAASTSAVPPSVVDAAAVDGLRGRIDRLELHAQIASTTAFVEATAAGLDTLVSVVLPTRDRPDLLVRAIDSVLGQSHHHWELLVVDDGDDRERVARLVDGLADPRVRYVESERRGSAAARNAGLAAATGSLVAYLDDDNVMQPSWLRAVAWAFDRWPDASWAYGARVYASSTDLRTDDRDVPTILFEAWDAVRLREVNLVDTGVLAHRSRLAGAWWDETLTTCTDWDLAVRLAETSVPRALPVLACCYTVDAPNRLTDDPGQAADRAQVQRRIRANRPLRVVAVNNQFPALTERYIGDEVGALVECGAEASYVSLEPGHPGLFEVSVIHRDLAEAVRAHEPDVAVIHWMTFAEQQADALAALEVPFAARSHSFDFSSERAARLLAHPYCVGVWLYPHHAALVPGSHALPALFTQIDRLPPRGGDRRLVMSASASLEKKDWDLWRSTLDRLPGIERRIVLGMTLGHESVVQDIAEWTVSVPDRPMLQVNLDADQVFALEARAAAVVYTIQDHLPIGNPMSIIEAMLSGASAVLPDRPDARAFGGPHSRYYSDADDLVLLLRELVDGGERVESEREANRAWGFQNHAAPELRKRFHAELTDAVAAWRAGR